LSFTLVLCPGHIDPDIIRAQKRRARTTRGQAGDVEYQHTELCRRARVEVVSVHRDQVGDCQQDNGRFERETPECLLPMLRVQTLRILRVEHLRCTGKCSLA